MSNNISSKPPSNSKTQQSQSRSTGILAQRSAPFSKRNKTLKGVSRIKFFSKIVNRINSICNQPSEQYWRFMRRANTGGYFYMIGRDGKPIQLNLFTERLRQQNRATMLRTQQWCKEVKKSNDGNTKNASNSKKNHRSTKRHSKAKDKIRKQKSRTSSSHNEIYTVEFPETSECTLDEMSSMNSLIFHSEFDHEYESAAEVNDWYDGPRTPPSVERHSQIPAGPSRSRRWKRPVIQVQKCAFCQVVIGDIAFINGTQQLCGECAEKHFEDVTKCRLQDPPMGYKEFKVVGGDTVYSAR